MTQRERLIEIIQKSVGGCAEYWAGKIADGLIESGVIIPPFKIGDSVFYISDAGCICEAKVEDIDINVFLTREEAEKALKEREENEKI